MRIATSFGLAAAAMVSGCGSLSVSKLSSAGGTGVPFYLPMQDITITKIDRDENHSKVEKEAVKYRVDLVTRADHDRAFLVSNSAAFFGDSTFSITRDDNGRALSISGKSKDVATETIQALAEVVVGAAQLMKSSDDDKRELGVLVNAIRKAQSDLEAVMKDPNLDKDPEGRAKKGREIFTLLAQLTARRDSLEKAAAKPKEKAVLDSGSASATTTVVADADEARAKAEALNEGEFGIFLVPVN